MGKEERAVKTQTRDGDLEQLAPGIVAEVQSGTALFVPTRQFYRVCALADLACGSLSLFG